MTLYNVNIKKILIILAEKLIASDYCNITIDQERNTVVFSTYLGQQLPAPEEKKEETIDPDINLEDLS